MKVHKLERVIATTKKGEKIFVLVPYYIRKTKRLTGYEPTPQAKIVMNSFQSWERIENYSPFV